MINIFQALVLAVSSTLDDLSVGFSMGVKKGRVATTAIWIIAIISGLTMATGLIVGERLSLFFPERIEVYISFILFTGFGIYFIWEGYAENKLKKVEQKVKDKTTDKKEFSWWGMITLGLVLGINSLALGFSGGLRDYPILLTSLMTMLASLVFVWSGSKFGSYLAGWIGDYTNYLAGSLLIIIGLLELI